MGKALHSLARHSVLGTLRRFLGPFAYEREMAEVLCIAYGAPSHGPVNGALLLDDLSHALTPSTLPRPAIVSKIDLRSILVSYVERLGEKDAAPADLGAMAHVDDAVPLDGSTLRPGALLSNPMGMPHGGALCIAASRAAARGDDPRSMPAEFLASRPGALDVEATATSPTTTEVVLSSGSARVFQASLAWDA